MPCSRLINHWTQVDDKRIDEQPLGHKPHQSLVNFFQDMPWLNIPHDRRTVFHEPPRLRGGLLGGSSSSGKMSKLQALAAARKKKAEDQKLENQKCQSSVEEIASEVAKRTSKHTPVPLAERLNSRLSAVSVHSLPINTKAQTHYTQDAKAERLDTVSGQACPSSLLNTEDIPPVEPLEPATPSAFAQTLLGFPTKSSVPVPPVPRNQYPIPYMSLTSSVADAFSEPSPDDVVITAQSKGSLLAKKVQA